MDEVEEARRLLEDSMARWSKRGMHLQHYRALQHDGYHLVWNRCGVLQLAEDEDEAGNAHREAVRLDGSNRLAGTLLLA